YGPPRGACRAIGISTASTATPAATIPRKRSHSRRLRARFAATPWPSVLLMPVIENFLDMLVEQTRDLERERKRRIVFAGLDRVDRLTRHAEPAAKLGLAPVAFRAKDFEAVFHDLVSVMCG